MTKGQQKAFLSLLASGKYRVDTEQGCLYSYRVGKDSWDRVKGTVMASGFRQVTLYAGTDRWPSTLTIYEHVAVWLGGHGTFPAGSVVRHRDDDPGNNKLWNLSLEVRRVKVSRSAPKEGACVTAGEVDEIYKIWASGERNHTRIAERLLVNRQKVRRVIAKLAAGEEFRFEQKYEVGRRLKGKYRYLEAV